MYEQTPASRLGGMANQATAASPPQPTRFSSCAGNLEAQVAHLNGLSDRFQRVADRLGGAIPTEAEKAGLRGNGSCVAIQLEQSLEDFNTVIRKLEGTAQRLESL